MSQRIFLQFGEAANSSMVHLWNYLSETDTASTADNDTVKSFGNRPAKRTLIFSERTGMKGILAQEQVGESLKSNIPADEATHVINQKTGRWTDFNYGTDFPESSYRESNQFNSGNFISSFYDSKSKSLFTEYFEEDTRKIVEACDWLEGFNFVSESCGSIGAATLHALEHLNDEYAKASKVVVSFAERIQVDSIESVHWQDFKVNAVEEALKFSLLHETISDQNTTFLPLKALSLCTLRPFEMNLTDAREGCRFFSAVFYDLFGAQTVPGKGQFASLMASIPTDTFNFTTNISSSPLLKSWRKAPLVRDPLNYQFESIDLVSYADFSPAPFTQMAEALLQAVDRPRPVWQMLESAGVSDELAAGDYYQELLESLHQIKDLSEYTE